MAVALGTIVCWAEPWLVWVALGSGTWAAAAVLGGALVAVAALVVLVVGTCRWIHYWHDSLTVEVEQLGCWSHLERWRLQRGPR